MIKIYEVKTSVFEGPMDLLLDLIEKKKLFINEISLAQVTDDYLTYIKSLPKTNLRSITSFVFIAATLVLIKSKSLLSSFKLTEEEESQVEDLERRLKMYKRIKEAGGYIKDNFGKHLIFSRPEGIIMEPVFSPDKNINFKNMLSLIKEILQQLPQKESLQIVEVKEVISIEEVINNWEERIKSGLELSFKNFSLEQNNNKTIKEKKIQVVVSFLAMLELIRQGIISAMQGEEFSDITIQKI